MSNSLSEGLAPRGLEGGGEVAAEASLDTGRNLRTANGVQGFGGLVDDEDDFAIRDVAAANFADQTDVELGLRHQVPAHQHRLVTVAVSETQTPTRDNGLQLEEGPELT